MTRDKEDEEVRDLLLMFLLVFYTKTIECLSLTAGLKEMYVHYLLQIVGNSVSSVQIGFVSSDPSIFGITCFCSFLYLTLACKHL